MKAGIKREIWRVELGAVFATKQAAQACFDSLPDRGAKCRFPETIDVTVSGEKNWQKLEKQERQN